MKQIGAKLRELRGDKVQSEVATDLKISISALSMYEQGERTPRDEVKKRFANYYGVPVGTLFFGEQGH